MYPHPGPEKKKIKAFLKKLTNLEVLTLGNKVRVQAITFLSGVDPEKHQEEAKKIKNILKKIDEKITVTVDSTVNDDGTADITVVFSNPMQTRILHKKLQDVYPGEYVELLSEQRGHRGGHRGLQ